MISLQKEIDLQTKNHEKCSLQELKTQVQSLQDANFTLEENLKQSGDSEKRSKDAQKSLVQAKDSLQSQLEDMRKKLMEKDKEIQKIQQDRANELDNIKEKTRVKFNELEHHLTQSEQEKVRVEANIACIEAEKDGLIEDHKRKCDEKLRCLVDQELKKKLAQLNSNTTKSGEHYFQPAQEVSLFSENTPNGLSKTQNGTTRKLITRCNTSVMDQVGFLKSLASSQLGSEQMAKHQCGEQAEDPDPGELGMFELLDKNGVSAVGNSSKLFGETQGLPTVFRFDAGRSSSSLSEPLGESDLLDMDEAVNTTSNVGIIQTDIACSPSEETHSKGTRNDVNSRIFNKSAREGFGHSESRANTSARMMGPPKTDGSCIMSRACESQISQSAKSRQDNTPQTDRDANSRSGSPDFMHTVGSVSKTYRQHGKIITETSTHERSSTPRAHVLRSSQKRKGTQSHGGVRSSKRHQSSLDHSPSSSLPHTHHQNLSQPAPRLTQNNMNAASFTPRKSGQTLRKRSVSGSSARSQRSPIGRTSKPKGMRSFH